MAREMSSDDDVDVSRAIFVRGDFAWMAAVASVPSILGIIRSISTMSGSRRRTPLIVDSPSSASPTTVKSSSASSSAASPIRTMAWSSAMNILVFLMFVLLL